MVALAISLGIYSYLILALGLLGWLDRLPVLLVSIPFLVSGVIWFKNNFHFNYLKWLMGIRKDRMLAILVGILIIQVIINFLGAISPELSFDALWYHLTPAKLYAQNHRIFYIPGWLLWPANLPKMMEMFYTVALLFSQEILAKMIHFSFGILSAAALFNLLKRYFNLRLSLLGVVTFYTMLMVGWQSTTAYVDLSRTFFEILALDLFLQWREQKRENLLLEAAIMVGLAISAKILALGTLLVFIFLIFVLKKKNGLKQVFFFGGLSLLIASPWFILSLPSLGRLRDPGVSLGGFSKLPSLLWQATLYPDDIISPLFLLFLPLVLVFIWKEKIAFKVTALYFLLAVFFAPVQSNRYLLPYLPGFTLVVLSVFNQKWKPQAERFLVTIILLAALLNLGSRLIATRKFLPYLLGKQSKAEFLSRNLNFAYGDFYDVDGWFAKNIKKEDLVLIYGIHNLYYVDFSYVHESWAKSGVYFTHLLIGENESLPEKFGQRLLLYQNPKTHIKLYLFGEKYQ